MCNNRSEICESEFKIIEGHFIHKNFPSSASNRVLPNDINIPFLSHLHEISSFTSPLSHTPFFCGEVFSFQGHFSQLYISFNLTSSTRNSTTQLWQGQSLVEDYPFFSRTPVIIFVNSCFLFALFISSLCTGGIPNTFRVSGLLS